MLENHPILTALITPFNEHDEIDYPALDKLIERLLAEHTTGLVVGATTGESPTLSHVEKVSLFEHVGQVLKGRAALVANIGTNSTRESVAFAKEVSSISAITAVLAVVPYYNKPGQAGMIAHFTAIADASAKPVIIYNIPGRSVVQLSNVSLAQLAKHPNIQGVKQCTTVEDLAWLVQHLPKDFAVYTGDDDQFEDALKVGARGVISVASHLYGNQMQQVIDELAAGAITAADQQMAWLTPRMHALFAYPSPAPVKMALGRRGEIQNRLRLPMVPLNETETQVVLDSLGELEVAQ
ncbi:MULTISPECIES: 4-hydroxy-tetrahydrodipicolinate synthase [unclassified Lacticaseibacillus]|uniref:4-hydroxy-tetrahydrodipicolinate synthase n=1 Tax=unclassified Lacticaseibacillus TaxID=2759744 RepID=UPI0019435FF4|nr:MULTISPECIES: 4-hydroxy-tetrahydrodipicolinate synthase [unclassified Lacticaseibacillus]